MSEWVELEDGERIPLSTLPGRVPHLSFQGALHLEVCSRLAADRLIDAAHDPVLANFLFTMSARARQLTALLTLIRARRLTVRRVSSRFIKPQMQDLFDAPVDIELQGDRPVPLLGVRQISRFLVKFCFHRIYRLFRRRRRPAVCVIRAWMDSTDRTFPEYVARDLLLVYPFLPNPFRQWRYLLHCRRAGRNWTLMGMPYSFGHALRVLFGGRNTERRLVEAEVSGFQRHAAELLAMGVRTVRTTDESDMASCSMHAALIRAGVTCINRMHGIGIYGPHVCYSRCSFYTTQQASLYCRVGRIASHDYLAPSTGPPGIAHAADRGPYQPVITFVQSNWRQVGKGYEATFEHAAMLKARQACERLDLPFVVKLHPSAYWQHRMRLRHRHGFTLIEQSAVLADRHPVFLNLLSTAYYDLLPLGPTLFLADELIDPGVVFGDHVLCVRLAEIDEALADFADPECWHRLHAAQREAEGAYRAALRRTGSVPA